MTEAQYKKALAQLEANFQGTDAEYDLAVMNLFSQSKAGKTALKTINYQSKLTYNPYLSGRN